MTLNVDKTMNRERSNVSISRYVDTSFFKHLRYEVSMINFHQVSHQETQILLCSFFSFAWAMRLSSILTGKSSVCLFCSDLKIRWTRWTPWTHLHFYLFVLYNLLSPLTTLTTFYYLYIRQHCIPFDYGYSVSLQSYICEQYVVIRKKSRPILCYEDFEIALEMDGFIIALVESCFV